MTSIGRFTTLGTALGAVLAGLGLAGTAEAQDHRLRLQAAVPSASIYYELLERYAERIEAMSGGRVDIEILADGAIVPAFEILDAVDQGVVEAGYAWTHYWSGKHPAAGLFSNPMAGAGAGLDQLSHMAWLAEGGGQELFDRFYEEVLQVNVKPFMVQPMGPDPLGWFATPIESVADFQQLRYRSPPGITGEIFGEMGVTSVALPGGEIVPAAQRGVIDAAEWIGPADDLNLGLNAIWKNYYLQGLHQSTDVGEIVINKDVWESFPEDIQAIFEAAALASVAETYAFNVARNAAAIVKLRDEFNVEIHDTPEDFFPEFVRATNVVLDRYAGQDAFFNEVLESQREFAETVVPYWTKILDLYSNLGNAALEAN